MITFDYLCNVTIDQSIETLTDTCSVTLPRRIKYQGALISLAEDTINGKPIFKRGDKIKIELGYDDVLVTRFQGYLKDVKNAAPIQLTCEDSMFALKTGSYSRANSSCTLEELLKDMLPAGIEFKAADINLGPFRVNQATPAKVLDSLKNDGIFSYFRNITENGTTKQILYSGLPYWTEKRNEHEFVFGKSIINDNDLIYRETEDVKLKVKAISIQKNNSRIETEVGDEEGEIRTVYKYQVSLQDLKLFAQQELERFRFTGYRGAVPVFGEPVVEKGDVIQISGSKYHPSGKYLAKAVKIMSGTSQGYKQNITIEQVV